jgi:hypothetical protein
MVCNKSYGHEIEPLLEASLDSFKKNDLNLYINDVMISQAELSEMIEFAIGEVSSSKLKKKLIKDNSVLSINYPEYKITVARNWKWLNKMAKEEGIDWSSASIINFTFRPNASSELINIRRGSFRVNFQSKEDLFSFQIDDCIKTLAGKWKCFDPVYFRIEG